MTKELLDADGENRAVRSFLMLYGGQYGISVEAMKAHMKLCGLPHWPAWADKEPTSAHLTKGAAQDWLRHLFTLEQSANQLDDINVVDMPAQQGVDWEKLYRLEVKKKEALAAKYERDTGKKLTRIVPMAEQPAQQQEPVAWRFTGIAGLKRYMTQTQYDAQTPETKKWYEPFLCANCTPSPQPAQQEPFALLVRKHSWNKGQYDCAPPNAPEYGRKWADERVWVYTAPPAQRKPWVGLTMEDKKRILDNDFGGNRADCIDASEKILREKNA